MATAAVPARDMTVPLENMACAPSSTSETCRAPPTATDGAGRQPPPPPRGGARTAAVAAADLLHDVRDRVQEDVAARDARVDQPAQERPAWRVLAMCARVQTA